MTAMDVGGLLRQARAKAGLSGSGLAAAAGVSRELVWRYETGRVSPTVAALDALLAACGLQVQRPVLEPLLADLDARVDALNGELPELVGSQWERCARSLDEGAVTWAVDGASALVLSGLASELDWVEVVGQLDDDLRRWMKSVWLIGRDERGRSVQHWYEATLTEMTEALREPTTTRVGFLRIRVVAQLPGVLRVDVPWYDHAVRVVTVDEVERSHPALGEVLARWRERRDRDVA
jgi:transcriptional regulator with XRE-family HTH domain